MDIFDLDVARELQDMGALDKGVVTYKNLIKNQALRRKATLLNLKFDKGVDIMRVMKTVNDYLIQIIASDNRFMFVITWDIVQNIEYAMI